tara:strand:- start:1146 stop:1289 length:144 start_codon:yes stop_codon:yes gene_type:complete
MLWVIYVALFAPMAIALIFLGDVILGLAMLAVIAGWICYSKLNQNRG